MPPRKKVCIALGQPAIDWLHKKVEDHEASSVGWVVEGLIKDEIAREKGKKQH